MDRIKIKEAIVVEGRDDESAIKRSIDAQIIITHGFGIREATFKLIEKAMDTTGVIIFTDPDYAGEEIRRRINTRIPGCKQAHLPRHEAMAGDNIGIENATDENILKALSKVHTINTSLVNVFTRQDLVVNDLVGHPDAKERRIKLGALLGIGYGNGKQFLSRLNHYCVTKEQFERGIKDIDEINITTND